MSLIELKNVSYSYPSTQKKILDNISLSIKEGDSIAVIGLNGSGKSTLSRLLAGFFNPSLGEVHRKAGIILGIVFQQPKEQIVSSIVERDTAFGPENLCLTKAETELRTIEALSYVSLLDKALCRTFEISLGQTQSLALSGILALDPDILVLDEATSMLDPSSRDNIIEIIGTLQRKGKTVLYITHDIDEALCAKRIIVMSQGKIVFDGKTKDFRNERSSLILDFKIENVLERENKNFSFLELKKRETALKVSNLSFSYENYPVFKDISFEIKKGSLVALTGPSGCGKSTLFECLACLRKPSSGKIKALSSPALCLQESEAALFETYAADDVAFGVKNQKVFGKDLLNRVKDAMKLSFLDYETFGNRSTFSLSGGEKRKLSIAGIIALDSDILIFDEPTSGLDYVSRLALFTSFRSLTSQGKTILFSTHNLDEAEIADIHLDWKDILKNQEGNTSLLTTEEKEESLIELNVIENASILDEISKASFLFSSPEKIPSSFVSRLSAGKKTGLFLTLFILSLVLFPLYFCLLMVLFSFLYAILAKYPLKKPFSVIARLTPWICLFSFISLLLFPIHEGERIFFQFGIFIVTENKLLLFFKSFLRSICAVFTLGTYIFTTDEQEIMSGLETLLKPLKVLKFPVRYVIIVTSIVFRFIPLLLDELSGIVKTQIIRGSFRSSKGLGKIKTWVSIIVPLILQTIRKAQILSDALTARYFK